MLHAQFVLPNNFEHVGQNVWSEQLTINLIYEHVLKSRSLLVYIFALKVIETYVLDISSFITAANFIFYIFISHLDLYEIYIAFYML